MLVVGSQPADYAPLHPADDLARCLRYYEVIPSSTGDLNVTAYGATGVSCMTPIPYKARKAVNPTMTKNGTWPVLNCGQPGAGAAGVDILSIAATLSSTGTYSFSSGAGINFTAESNPMSVKVTNFETWESMFTTMHPVAVTAARSIPPRSPTASTSTAPTT